LAIQRIWLQQPIAFARVGKSTNPVPAFRWTYPDLRPRGSARTAIFPEPSFKVNHDTGELKQTDDPFILFKDEEGICPVCPFFELHGEWDGQDPKDTRLTQAVLLENNLTLADIEWQIHHANHKAYIATHAEGDRIEAHLRFSGDDHGSHELIGYSPRDAPKPLVPLSTDGIAMGSLRAIRPTGKFPHIRLRFTAPKGLAYGPSDLVERLKPVPKSKNIIGWVLDWLILKFNANEEWTDFKLPSGQMILNPQAAWMDYKLLTYGEVPSVIGRIIKRFKIAKALLCAWDTQQSEALRFAVGPRADVGKLPPGLFASWRGNGAALSSLGMVDDLGDGVITCTLAGVGTAKARIVVGPPHFSPDRRPPVSIADDLLDKEDRAGPRNAAWASGANLLSAKLEVQDLLDRAFETAGASNLDAWADQRREENASAAVYRGDPEVPKDPDAPIWRNTALETVTDLPLFEHGTWQHRRNSAGEFFEQIVRDTPDLIERWIRDQDDPLSVYYDKKMPALMRGSDRRPLHLTRRQMEAFRRWFEAIRAEKEQENSAEIQQGQARIANIKARDPS
jgi:hypothetical protein